MGELQTGVRVRAEGLGITLKSITTVLVLFLDKGHSLALVAFALGQLMYSCCVVASYTLHFGFVRPVIHLLTDSPWR